jgi:hypothetical protein
LTKNLRKGGLKLKWAYTIATTWPHAWLPND